MSVYITAGRVVQRKPSPVLSTDLHLLNRRQLLEPSSALMPWKARIRAVVHGTTVLSHLDLHLIVTSVSVLTIEFRCQSVSSKHVLWKNG